MKIRVKICRYDPEKDKAPYFKTYMVDYEPGMRLLHALEHVKNEKEPSLAFRWNCGAGRCGSCAAEVNGRPVLICKYEVPHKAEEIVIEPMKVFPIVRDLVTDLAVMREAQGKIPAFKSAKKPFFKMYDYDIGMAKEMKKCIECGICQDICHVIREHKKNYIGPRFIVKLASFETHPFDSRDRAAIAEKLGVGYCNVTKCCQAVCPERIRITDDAIIPIKEKIARRNRKEFIKKFFRLGDKK